MERLDSYQCSTVMENYDMGRVGRNPRNCEVQDFDYNLKIVISWYMAVLVVLFIFTVY